MPELPEVEYAAGVARAASDGKRFVAVRVLHVAARRHLSPARARSLVGDRVDAVTRRGKHQLFALETGRTLHVHFRMTGDWCVSRAGEPPETHARVLFDFDDGTRLSLIDSRALAVVALYASGIDPLPELGPEATARAFNVRWLRDAFAHRRTPIKPALLDQRLVAGVGNIYASEALWYARIDPRTVAAELSDPQLAAVAAGVKRALRRALARPARYYGGSGPGGDTRFNVYDREGESCSRCGTAIARIAQGARSTYFCPRCQS